MIEPETAPATVAHTADDRRTPREPWSMPRLTRLGAGTTAAGAPDFTDFVGDSGASVT